MRVTVLHNLDHLSAGPGQESREDVLRVAEAVARALRGAGHAVSVLGVGDDPLRALAALRGPPPPDLVFNLCESLRGDARGEMAMAAALELLRVPNTGSDPLALGLALHKDRAKALLRHHGIPTPDWWLLKPGDAEQVADPVFPLIVKPAREDGSLGISFDSVVGDEVALRSAIEAVWRLDQPALVERYIDGRELMVSFVGNAPRRVLPLREIAFGPAFTGRPRIVSYRAKWIPTAPECLDSPSVSSVLPRGAAERVVETALHTCDVLGCRDYGRVDIRLSPEGVPYVIDVNPNCDLHPEAGFARGAAEAGLSYPALVSTIAEVAREMPRGDPTAAGERSAGAGRVARADQLLLDG